MTNPGQWSCADVWADSTFLFVREKANGTNEFFTWNITERRLNPVIGQADSEKYQVRFAADGNEFFVLTSNSITTNEFIEPRLATSILLPCSTKKILKELKSITVGCISICIGETATEFVLRY